MQGEESTGRLDGGDERVRNRKAVGPGGLTAFIMGIGD